MSVVMADSRRHAAIAHALYVSAFLMGAVTCAFSAVTLLPELPAATCAAVPTGILAITFYLVARSRDSMALLLGSLTPRERLAGALVAVALVAAPSMILRSWAVLPGLLALHIPMVCILANETAFSRYYALNGLTCAVVTASCEPEQAWTLIALFAALLVVTMTCDHWHFTLERTPNAVAESPLRPFALAARRFVVAALFTVPLALVTPQTRPVGLRIVPMMHEARPRLSSHAYELTLMKLFLETMVLVLVFIALGALIKLYRKLRQRRQQQLPPEAIGAPVGVPHSIGMARKARLRLNMHNPRDIVVYWYARLSESLKVTGMERTPSQTPEEYRRSVTNRVPEAAEKMRDITDRFVVARYDSGPVTPTDAETFRGEVEQLIEQLRQSAE